MCDYQSADDASLCKCLYGTINFLCTHHNPNVVVIVVVCGSFLYRQRVGKTFLLAEFMRHFLFLLHSRVRVCVCDIFFHDIRKAFLF